MSRSLTVTQIVNQGDYLNNDFDPNTLTVSQLLGVLAHHQIRYPTPYTKAKLVQSFLDEIRPRATKLRKEKLKRENSFASDDGITDGITGKPLGADSKVTRRSSHRLSHAPEDDGHLQKPEPPKRRRSSAQPNLGGNTGMKTRANVPTLVEESEPEEHELPVRKAARRRKDDPRAPRKSLADDSGWEDNNIFQSGAESSSPTRPSPVRRTGRQSMVHNKPRYSMSEPPRLSPPSSPTKVPHFPQSTQRSPSRPKFDPLDLPESVGVPECAIEESGPDQQMTSVLQPIPGSIASHMESGVKPRRYLLAFLYAICILASSGILINFKKESASIGYCDIGSNSSQALQEFQAHISAIEQCARANRTFLDISSEVFDAITTKDGTGCPTLSLIPLPHPSACAPCPEYASCVRHTVTCNSGYLQRPHPILALLSPFGAAPPAPVELIWNFISEVANGLPGLGPVAFPPYCIEDPRRKRNIGALGKAIEAHLGQERGSRICAGGEGGQLTISDSEGGEARKWGLEVEVLREKMKQKTAPHLLNTFDDTFNEAMQQLDQWGSVVFGNDTSGRRYVAHKTANLTLDCKVTVWLRQVWLRWRTTVFVLFASASMVYALRRSRAHRQKENKRVAELVQIALDTLRNQELAYHTDPVTAPQPYLSSLQLRDLILQDEHSIPTRKRVWDQVEQVVEGNANVRVNLEEIQGGDEHRVWRWVGSTGRGPEGRKRVRIETEKGDGHVA